MQYSLGKDLKSEGIEFEVLCIQPDFLDTGLSIFLLRNSFPTPETSSYFSSYLLSTIIARNSACALLIWCHPWGP